ncbi:hypothetical protein [Parvicella tangerina]|uniref:Outer membrane protein beta-barrel domain-containing protein n=1 Tax=Parvicella tangerina TaxID=2829795 RepID=A0A916JL62_9FLAO|nr:hypothetical protein [Parvicella tangerina]CAG5079643.1 hypothetical protein CRYO30217_00997 [Parvicella tangerina]
MKTIKWILLGCLLTFFRTGWSQNTGLEKYNEEFHFVPTLALNNDFNTDDWYTGLSGGIEDIGYQWGVRLGFQFRPFRKKIQVIENSSFIRQYQERKYLIFLDVDKRFAHFSISKAHIQFYLGARGGFLMGNYSGTRNDADNHWVAAPFAGVCANVHDNVFFKLGYMYFPDQLLNVDDGRIQFSMVFSLRPLKME